MKALIVGYGKSGQSAERFLKSKGYEVLVLDENVLNKTSFEKNKSQSRFDPWTIVHL